MGDIQWAVFGYIVSQVETPLVSAVATVTNAFLTFVAAPLKVALVLYIALTGVLIIRGETSEAGAPLLGRILKMAIVVWVITGAGVYQQYVYDFFFTALPTGLANALTSSGAAGAVSADSFDKVWIKAWRAGLEVWRTLSWRDIAEKFVICIFWLAAIISTVFCFAIWLISRVLLALYIAIGPLLIGLVLFPATRSIFERWIGALISCVILQITTIVLLYIILEVEAQVVGQVAAMGSVDAMAMIQVLLAGVIFFAVAAFVAFQLPGVASSLAGGLHFHVGAVARTIQSTIGSMGQSRPDGAGGTYREGRSGALGLGLTAGTFAARGAVAGSRAVYRRVRPPTGGSLSDRGSG
ncbi:type IV secretion system protein [Agrobacterium rosae]|uniref:Type IV secretion system protein VirB6 n=1 Tax=Agrobacterium rosae TaxID=1972867 RepID=A0A1R3U2R4_9HYPH|nr:type IV secretion system protein [Agrobacterium rosae]SCX35828.1 Type IV secretion system protein VirB6 [Agrobacterium rosae]